MSSRASLRRVNVVPGVTPEAQRAIAEMERNTAAAVRQTEVQKLDSLGTTNVKRSAYAAKLGELVLCDPSSGTFTVTLPKLSRADAGRHIAVKNTTSSLNGITVRAAAGQEVDGADGYNVNGSYDSVWLVSDGANWWRLGP